MNYIEFDFTVTPKEPGSEILVAHLSEIGFESFVETDTGILAYIPTAKYLKREFQKLEILKNINYNISFTQKNITDRNWNEEWEKNYNAVNIAGKCNVRAPFHPADTKSKYDIIIEPKMSFGTAHHETTALMIEQIMELDMEKRSVLDMGCGTAVLAILAAKMKALPVTAIDNDEWAYKNSLENIKRNNVGFIKVLFGGIEKVKERYDIIFANINRNILMNDIPAYAEHLTKGGILLMSGFYVDDMTTIGNKAKSTNLTLCGSAVKNNWVVAKFEKK